MMPYGLAAILVILLAGTAFSQSDAIPDTENCLLCHRYPSLGRFDKKGVKRIFYINDEKFANSAHGNLRCKSCHVGLDEIPHTDVKKVDCATKCHIKEPSTDKEFSHNNMIDKYQASVHGTENKAQPVKFPEDLPTCKDCHLNPMYVPFSGMLGKSEALSNETLSRCIGCHPQKQWAKKFYSHFTKRLRRRRSPSEIITLCTGCHEDREKMARHGLETIDTYKDTFHWAQIKFGVENAPDCISCHAPVGYTTHDLRPREDPISPINANNRVKTCSNQGGVQECHPAATVKFASGRVHAYGEKARMKAGNGAADGENQDMALVRKRAEADITTQEAFQFSILQFIRLFYKLLIGGTIGFMCLHQFLAYMSAKRKHGKSP